MKKKIIKLLGLVVLIILLTTLKGIFTGNQNVLNLTYQEIKFNEIVDLTYNVIVFLIAIFGTYKIIGVNKGNE